MMPGHTSNHILFNDITLHHISSITSHHIVHALYITLYIAPHLITSDYIVLAHAIIHAVIISQDSNPEQGNWQISNTAVMPHHSSTTTHSPHSLITTDYCTTRGHCDKIVPRQSFIYVVTIITMKGNLCIVKVHVGNFIHQDPRDVSQSSHIFTVQYCNLTISHIKMQKKNLFQIVRDPDKSLIKRTYSRTMSKVMEARQQRIERFNSKAHLIENHTELPTIAVIPDETT